MSRGARRRTGPLAGVAFCAALATLAGCGKVGPPRAPEFVIPKTADPVEVESAADGVKVTWKRPREYVDGEALDDLAGFEVLRACQPETTFARVATVPVTDQGRFRKASSFTMLDHAAPLGVSCRYRVIAFTFDEYTSPPAESADVVRTVPGAAP
jgi:hypothetical protein